MASDITELHKAVTDAVSAGVGKPAAGLCVKGRWYASVAVVNKRVFAVILELGDECGLETDVDKHTGMTTLRVVYTEDTLPDTDGVVETARIRAQLFKDAA